MDRNKRFSVNKGSSPQFKRRGGNKRERWQSSRSEQFLGNSDPGETLYRILCPSTKIGGVIGKGGNIIKALREETKAKITVADAVPGSDERVIIIYSSPVGVPISENDLDDADPDNASDKMEPQCPAQDALLKVHQRIIEEDLFGGMAFEEDDENNTVTVRLLVPNNTVGCLLGKRGDVIQRLRSDTSASIRVLPAEHLPTCAMSTDELVQISGTPKVVKRALFEVSTLLHENPRKDNPPRGFPISHAGQGGFHPVDMPLRGGMPPMPWIGGYRDQSPGFAPGDFNGPPGPGPEASGEFSMKILCSTGKIGGVIGKGGFNVKQIQQETGASIHVEEASVESEERIIRVSAFEGLWNPISQTIDAILCLQNKTSEFSEKGSITTRLLVPSSKIGCILGQGGHVINEMRRRTKADIRVHSKDDKPKCASENEELVQISGNFAVAKDALAEIASRLRVRTLRDANAGVESVPIRPFEQFGPLRNLPDRRPPPSGMIAPGGSRGHERIKGGEYDFEPQSFRVPPVSTRFPSSVDAKFANDLVRPGAGARGSNISNGGEVVGARLKFYDPGASASEHFPEIRDSSELKDVPGAPHALGKSNPPQRSPYPNSNAQRSSYHNIDPQHNSYQSIRAPPYSYQDYSLPDPFQKNSQSDQYYNMNSQQDLYNTRPDVYQNQSAHQDHCQSISSHQDPYQNTTPYQDFYQNTNTQQGHHPNVAAQHGHYQNAAAQQAAYPNASSSAPQGLYKY